MARVGHWIPPFGAKETDVTLKPLPDPVLNRPGGRGGGSDRDTAGLRKPGRRGRSHLELLSHHRILPPFASFCPSPEPPLQGGLSQQVKGREGQQGVPQPSVAWQPLQELGTNLQSLTSGASAGSCSQVQLWPSGCPKPPASPPGRMGDRGPCCWQEFTVHAGRVRVPQICPPQAGHSSPRHGRASMKLGQVLSDAFPCLTSAAGPFQQDAMQLNPPWQACGTPWHGQRTGSETLRSFIEGDPARRGPGELPGQQLLPGEEPGGGTLPHCHHSCLPSPSLAGTWSRKPARTESCHGNHTQHFPVIQDIFSPPPQMGGMQRAALLLHPLHTQPHGSPSSERQEPPAL